VQVRCDRKSSQGGACSRCSKAKATCASQGRPATARQSLADAQATIAELKARLAQFETLNPAPFPVVGTADASTGPIGLSELEMSALVAHFCDHCLPCLPIFSRKVPPLPSAVRLQSPLLLSAILAIASRYVPGSAARDPRQLFDGAIEQAGQVITARLPGHRPFNAHDVQGLLFLAAWSPFPLATGAFSEARRSWAWTLLGNAIRLAQELGLFEGTAQEGVDEHEAAQTALGCLVLDRWSVLALAWPSP
jgi:hypothetical protein